MRFVIEDGQLGADLDDGVVSVGPVLSTGVWQHVAFTYDGVDARFFLNGESVGSNSLFSTSARTSAPPPAAFSV